MARIVQVRALVDTDEIVNYAVCSAPSDVLFYTRDGIQYCSFWNPGKVLVQIPVSQLISID
jgi:hypothetical protein